MFSTLLETLQSVAANPGEHVPWLLFITAVIALVSTLAIRRAVAKKPESGQEIR